MNKQKNICSFNMVPKMIHKLLAINNARGICGVKWNEWLWGLVFEAVAIGMEFYGKNIFCSYVKINVKAAPLPEKFKNLITVKKLVIKSSLFQIDLLVSLVTISIPRTMQNRSNTKKIFQQFFLLITISQFSVHI